MSRGTEREDSSNPPNDPNERYTGPCIEPEPQEEPEEAGPMEPYYTPLADTDDGRDRGPG